MNRPNNFNPLAFALWAGSFLAAPILFASGEHKDERSDGKGITSVSLKASEAGVEGKSLFESLSAEKTGITHLNPIDDQHPLRRVYHSSSACGGIAIGDVNLDGVLDVFLGNGARENSLYLGGKDNVFSFTNVAKETGLEGDFLSWAVGVAMVDIDNDGDLDLYLCNYDIPNQLFINHTIEGGKKSDGPLRFTEKAAEYGLDVVDGSVMPAFADYDRDGDLDMYLLCHQIYRAEGRPAEPIRILEDKNGKLSVDDPWKKFYEVSRERGENGEILYSEVGRPDRLFRNDGDKGFTDVTEAAGINTKAQWGNSSTWWDYNHDGWPDLYVGNDFSSPDFIYRNNGDGTFTDVAKELLRHTTWFSMGAVQTDLNNDGLTDFVLADMLPTSHYMQKASMGSMGSGLEDLKYVGGATQLMRNAVYINTGTDHFMESAWLSGLAMTEWTWAIRSADFDNDGLSDVFFTNGIPRQFNHSDLPKVEHEDLVGKTHWDHYKGTPERREQNMMFKNKGDFAFDDVSKEWGVDHKGISYGASYADFDGDGNLELLVANLQDPTSFYRNRGSGGNRILIDFVGTQSNRYGIGCQVTIETVNGKQVRQHYPLGGFLDGDDTVVHFGLGDLEKVDLVRVDWPSGQTQVFRDLDVNRKYTVTEPEAAAEKVPAVKSRKPANPQFSEVKSLKGFKHKEVWFDDFVRQSLLPIQLSQLGPGQAWGDIDGDGDPDFYLGGAAGQPGQLFRNTTKPGSDQVILIPVPVLAFNEDEKHEDMGVLFFDADGDGDSDLYVVSGSVECDPGAEVLRDRLYLNKGNGDFEKAEGSLPDNRFSGSVVAACDFDHDGDLDLFVGGRVVPGEYPVTPTSSLLQNRGDGTFEDVTRQVSPELVQGGLVTSALWSDVNNDAWQDLLVVNEWGPVSVFINKDGKLVRQNNESTGFGKTTGWYNGIDGRDLDGDGDIDFVVSNFGRNTQYQPTLEAPSLIFYGDFDHSGRANIVEALFEKGEDGKQVCFPLRGLSCSSHAMPMVREKMKTYHNFASAQLTQIYDVNLIKKSITRRASSLDSIVMINDGQGHFEISSLPRLAQISPGFGIALSDVDLDGHADCYMVHNFFTPQEETGPMDSGLSLLMKGTGDPANPFVPVWPRESGLEVPGDAKSLASVDVNLDGLEDFIVGVNNEEPMIFLNRKVNEATHPMRIRISGAKGNPTAIGARVIVEVEGFPTQVDEIRAGGGYLTQKSSDLIFAIPNDLKTDIQITLVWPEGVKSKTTAKPETQFLNLSRN